MLTFHFQRSTSQFGPRVGQLRTRGRPQISTPSFIAVASRGSIPHVTPDLLQKHTRISAIYSGLEDFVERSRQDAPILKIPPTPAIHASSLRDFTSTPDQCWTILGPRRVPAVETPQSATNDSIPIRTSVGFRTLDFEDFRMATRVLKPDIQTTLVDLAKGGQISQKRKEKMADRTHAWVRDTLTEPEPLDSPSSIFASIPPLEAEQQSFYLADLAHDFKDQLSGICIYQPSSATVIPDRLHHLPVICTSNPQSPQELLNIISLGIDLVTVPFVTLASEAGIALVFKFPGSDTSTDQPLGLDLWSTDHAANLSPLSPSCSCYACSRHHRAYVHHLLQAKEMLAWTLLQIHNFHVMDQFFDAVRQSISNGTFEEDSMAFRHAYESQLPQQTGLGPRVRGYLLNASAPNDNKVNRKAYNRLDEQVMKLQEAGAGIAAPTVEQTAGVLEEQGLGETAGSI